MFFLIDVADPCENTTLKSLYCDNYMLLIVERIIFVL